MFLLVDHIPAAPRGALSPPWDFELPPSLVSSANLRGVFFRRAVSHSFQPTPLGNITFVSALKKNPLHFCKTPDFSLIVFFTQLGENILCDTSSSASSVTGGPWGLPSSFWMLCLTTGMLQDPPWDTPKPENLLKRL